MELEVKPSKEAVELTQEERKFIRQRFIGIHNDHDEMFGRILRFNYIEEGVSIKIATTGVRGVSVYNKYFSDISFFIAYKDNLVIEFRDKEFNMVSKGH